jgi:hypothetical protein
MSKFNDIDSAILAAIINGNRTFSAIFHSSDLDIAGANSSFSVTQRLVDRRLQALRKKKKIRYQAKQWLLESGS